MIHHRVQFKGYSTCKDKCDPDRLHNTGEDLLGDHCVQV